MKIANNSEKVESSSYYPISPLSLKLMIEVRLVTRCSKFEALGKLLPQLWEYAKTTNLDCTNFEGSPKELEALDDGKYFIN